MRIAEDNVTDGALGNAIEKSPHSCPNCSTPKTEWRWGFFWFGHPIGDCPNCSYTNHRIIIRGN